MVLDRIVQVPSKPLSNLHAASGKAPTYLYQFNLDFPIWYQKSAWHCSDIPFFFHNTERVEVCGFQGAKALEKAMSGAFVNFAKYANPNNEALINWPMVTKDTEPTMLFDQECRVGIGYDDALLDLLNRVLPPFNFMQMAAEQEIQH